MTQAFLKNWKIKFNGKGQNIDEENTILLIFINSFTI